MSDRIPPYFVVDQDFGPVPSRVLQVSSREEFLKRIYKYWNLGGMEYDLRFVEIGVFKGDFSRMILDIICPKQLYLIDPFKSSYKSFYDEGMGNIPTDYSSELEYAEVLNRFSKEIVSGQVTVIPFHSYDATKYINDGTLDVLYLDASHLYQHVKKDLNDWLPKMKPHSLICGHDYTDNPSFGVKQAVDEFMKENNFEMVLLNQQGGDFALMRK